MSAANGGGFAPGGSVHMVGIGGAGMSALAQMLAGRGARVSGCDLHPGAGADALRDLGITVEAGHDPAHVQDVGAVVTTAAVPATHPELEAARQRGIPVLKRAVALGALVNTGTVVAIAGTHGKTTTTAMATEILAEAGLDPTGVVGGRVAGWQGGLRAGSSDLFVVEADEYDRSFLTLRPRAAVVTTLEADHLDIYGNLDAVESAFREFVSLVSPDGVVACCADDAGAARLLRETSARVRTIGYGLGAGAALRATDVRQHERGSRFVLTEDGVELGEVMLAVPGRHNVQNALGAFAAARHIGVDFEAAARAFQRFGGVERRFQELGNAAGAMIVDDYAHHPTEIEATLEAARGRFAGRRIVAVFQPHLYSRTRDFAAEFGRALRHADAVWVTDVYAAREAPIVGVSGELVVDAVRRAGGADVRYHPAVDGLAGELLAELRPGDVCLTLGAGDIYRAARELIARGGDA